MTNYERTRMMELCDILPFRYFTQYFLNCKITIFNIVAGSYRNGRVSFTINNRGYDNYILNRDLYRILFWTLIMQQGKYLC